MYAIILSLFCASLLRNEKSAKLLRTVLIRENLNHYGSLAQRGLSSFFSRKFITYNNITGLVKNSQHIYSGVTKRGSVDIVLEHDNIQYDLCSVSAVDAVVESPIGIVDGDVGVFSSACSPPDLGTSRRCTTTPAKKTRPTKPTCRQRLVWS